MTAGRMCPTCGHAPHDGHQYEQPPHCDGCWLCRKFTARYRLLERWHKDVDEMLGEMDAEFTMRQTAIAYSRRYEGLEASAGEW